MYKFVLFLRLKEKLDNVHEIFSQITFSLPRFNLPGTLLGERHAGQDKLLKLQEGGLFQ
jgi:hypothetical protein